MSRIFAYVRVSTSDQETENQIQEIKAAGFDVEPHRIIKDIVSGSRAIAQREGFKILLNKVEKGDVLIVTKMDRLGRNAIDVSMTVNMFEKMGVKVHCLALGGVDLTSSAGQLTMGVINTVAQFERDLLIERTQSGLKRAKEQGKKLGRPRVLSKEKERDILQKIAQGISISALSREYKVSRQTIMRLRDNIYQ